MLIFLSSQEVTSSQGLPYPSQLLLDPKIFMEQNKSENICTYFMIMMMVRQQGWYYRHYFTNEEIP